MTITPTMQPTRIIISGCMVGVIVIAMYLPMFKMLSLVK